MSNSIRIIKSELRKVDRTLLPLIEKLKSIENKHSEFYKCIDRIIINHQTSKVDLLKYLLQLNDYLKTIDGQQVTKMQLREIADQICRIEWRTKWILNAVSNIKDVTFDSGSESSYLNKYKKMILNQPKATSYMKYVQEFLKKANIDFLVVEEMLFKVRTDSLKYMTREQANKAITNGTYYKPTKATGSTHLANNTNLPKNQAFIFMREKWFDELNNSIKVPEYEKVIENGKYDRTAIRANQELLNIHNTKRAEIKNNHIRLQKAAAIYREQLKTVKAFIKYLTRLEDTRSKVNRTIIRLAAMGATQQELESLTKNSLNIQYSKAVTDFQNLMFKYAGQSRRRFKKLWSVICKTNSIKTEWFKSVENTLKSTNAFDKVDKVKVKVKALNLYDPHKKAFENKLLPKISEKAVVHFNAVAPPEVELSSKPPQYYHMKVPKEPTYGFNPSLSLSQKLQYLSLQSALYTAPYLATKFVSPEIIKFFDIRNKDTQYLIDSSVNQTFNTVLEYQLYRSAEYIASKLPSSSSLAQYCSSSITNVSLGRFLLTGLATGVSWFAGKWAGGKAYSYLEKSKNNNPLAAFFYRRWSYIGVPFKEIDHRREFYFNEETVEWETRWKVKPERSTKVRCKSNRFTIRHDLISEPELVFFFQWQKKSYRRKYSEYASILSKISELGIESLTYLGEDEGFFKTKDPGHVDVNDYKVNWKAVVDREWYNEKKENYSQPVLFIQCPKTKEICPVSQNKVFTEKNLAALENYIRIRKTNPKKARKLFEKIKPVSIQTREQRISSANKLAVKYAKEQKAIRLMYYRSKLSYNIGKLLVYINYFGTGSTSKLSYHKVRGFIKRYMKDNAMELWEKKRSNGTSYTLKKIEKKLIEIKSDFKKSSSRYKKRHAKHSATYARIVKNYKKYKEKYVALLESMSREEIKGYNGIGQKFVKDIVISYDVMSKKTSRSALSKSINNLTKKHKHVKESKKLAMQAIIPTQRRRAR